MPISPNRLEKMSKTVLHVIDVLFLFFFLLLPFLLHLSNSPSTKKTFKLNLFPPKRLSWHSKCGIRWENVPGKVATNNGRPSFLDLSSSTREAKQVCSQTIPRALACEASFDLRAHYRDEHITIGE
jgi:hypothetical protein